METGRIEGRANIYIGCISSRFIAQFIIIIKKSNFQFSRFSYFVAMRFNKKENKLIILDVLSENEKKISYFTCVELYQ